MDEVLNEELVDVEKGILHHEEGVDLMPAKIECHSYDEGI